VCGIVILNKIEFLTFRILRNEFFDKPGSNCGYDPIVMIESFWVNVWLGGVNFSHTAMVRFDDGLKKIFGWKRLPCVSTYTRFFKRFKREDIDNIFGKINRWFFEQMPERSFTVDLDSTVDNTLRQTRRQPGGI